MQDFRNLAVWRKSHELTLEIYRQTASFPRCEQYGLVSQLRRASSSVAANIAEGCGRGSDSDFKRFLSMAMGSASETQYHLLLAKDLQMLHVEAFDMLCAQVQDVKRMLASLIKKLKSQADS
ncbi:MAG: four helix bundle protein [Planctomycetaceae bacterium]|nr:four helix bundle protein [Planctomycetaceae bacterium]